MKYACGRKNYVSSQYSLVWGKRSNEYLLAKMPQQVIQFVYFLYWHIDSSNGAVWSGYTLFANKAKSVTRVQRVNWSSVALMMPSQNVNYTGGGGTTGADALAAAATMLFCLAVSRSFSFLFQSRAFWSYSWKYNRYIHSEDLLTDHLQFLTADNNKDM